MSFIRPTALACMVLGFALATVAGPAPDVILHHTRVVTVDRAFSIHDAIALRGGRIAAVGSNREILRTRGPDTRVIDLRRGPTRGRLIVPGWIDSHAHAAAACMTEFDHPIPSLGTIEEVLGYIRARTQQVPAGRWIVVRQVFITRLKEQRYPTRAELDQAAPHHPVAFQTGPDASLNSRALLACGIDRDFVIRDGGAGFVEKDSRSGEPTGLLRNCNRFVKADPELRTPGAEDRRQRLGRLFASYNANGITAFCDRDASPENIELYRAVYEQGGRNIRAYLSHGVPTLGPIEPILDRIREIGLNPLFTRRDPFLRIIGIKCYLDGGMLTGSAYLREPWGVSTIYGITDPAYRGVLFIPPDRLRRIVRTAATAGLQFTAHAVGDGAVHALLDTYADLDPMLPLRATRPCISHANFLSREAIESAARLGVCMDLQPVWLHLDAHTLVRQFGTERLRYFQPLRSLIDAGVIAGGGSDHMQKIGANRAINPYSPLLGIATAVTRKARNLPAPLHPEESLERADAIRFYTLNNARILGCDDIAGSLEAGKEADLAVLDTDILTCPADRIASAKVLQTWVAGRLVFDRAKPAPDSAPEEP